MAAGGLRSLVGWVSLGACLATAASSWADDSAKTRPNFVVILADDLGYGDLGCYGNDSIETPHLDRLVKGGLRWTQFYASGPVCSPTRAGLMTGRYQQRAGVPGVINADPAKNRHHGLSRREDTLAESLRSIGYRTAIFGKWHLGYDVHFNPTHHGFDEFRGFVSGNIDYQSHFDRMGYLDWWRDDEIDDETGYSTHLITKHAVQFIERHRDRPFFLYVAHEAPHTPFQGPNDPAFRREGKVVPERRSPEHRERAYREMVEELDRGVGDVVGALEEHELSERTYVFFFSDNGGARFGSNGPLRGHKGSLWEGGIRVPAIAWAPGRVAPGQTTDAVGITLDVFPTLLELAGAEEAKRRRLDGRSFAARLVKSSDRRAAPPSERALFWEFGRQAAVRRGDWKLLRPARGDAQLFHLGRDPVGA